ncbi:MAG: glycosyltransferase [Bdellovibrionales bacterium]
MINRLIISPSGNYYGSEQVLHDYLSITGFKAEVWVPSKSIFWEILKTNTSGHKIKGFNAKYVYLIYIWVALKLLIKKYNVVYLNEAGHLNYIILLSKFFSKVKFCVHVRMLEDTVASRWPENINDNVAVISVSHYIKDRIPVKSLLVYDLYKFHSSLLDLNNYTSNLPLRIAIIGRITASKGLWKLIELTQHLEAMGIQNDYIFSLFGDVSTKLSDVDLIAQLRNIKNVRFEGFEQDKSVLYQKTDCVLHCSTQEALGRIFVESIDYLRPFIGFRNGGIEEIGTLVGLEKLLVVSENFNAGAQIIDALVSVKYNYNSHVNHIIEAKEKAKSVFSATRYSSIIDRI